MLAVRCLLLGQVGMVEGNSIVLVREETTFVCDPPS